MTFTAQYDKVNLGGFLMKTKKLLALMLAGAMSLSMLAGCGGGNNGDTTTDTNGDANTETTSDLAYVQDKGKMVIGYTVYEPMNYTDENGEFTGFDTEFAKAEMYIRDSQGPQSRYRADHSGRQLHTGLRRRCVPLQRRPDRQRRNGQHPDR